MKLFCDDLRTCPEGWTPARTVTEAIRILATQNVSAVSLDHDIQCRHNIPSGWTHEIGNTHLESVSPETFEAVAHFLHALYPYQNSLCNDNNEVAPAIHNDDHTPYINPVAVYFHTSNAIGGKKMAEILGIQYDFTHYPYDFRKDRDVKESWEE